MPPKWLQLESNPEIVNKYLKTIGVPSSVQAGDVFGLDPELLMMVPQPCIAVLFLYPISQGEEEHRVAETAKIEKEGQDVPKDVFYMTQTIGNACGTIGLFHAIANNLDKVKLEKDSMLANFIDKTKDLSPPEKCEILEGMDDIADQHQAAAAEGSTDAENPPGNGHFIAFTHVGGKLLEMDGRKGQPIVHGDTTADTFLNDAAAVCKTFMVRNPDSTDFNLMSLHIDS